MIIIGNKVLSLNYILALYALYSFLKTKGLLPKKSLRGEHIFLTGAGSGLGRLMAIQFAKMGSNLSLSDVNMEGLEETSKYNINEKIYIRKDDIETNYERWECIDNEV